MKSIFKLIFLLSFVRISAQEPISNSNREIVFQHVNVIPMDTERLLENQDVIVKDGKIQAIGKSNNLKFGKDAIVIDAKAKYLIPGLGEMHAHVPPVDNLEPMKEVLMLFALNGVTTIRGMLGHPMHLVLRDKISRSEILGPRFYTSGPSLNGQTVKSPETGEEMVREQKLAGYDFLKLHPGLTKEKFDAIAKTAKEVNIPFAGHVSFEVGIWHAIDAGYATIDHLDGFIEGMVPGLEKMKENDIGLFGMFISEKADTTQIPRLMNALREHHIWVVPTQSLAERWFSPVKDANSLSKEPEMKYMDKTILNNWVQAKTNLMNNPKYDAKKINEFIRLRRKLIYECNKNRVGLLLGSDAPQVFDVPGFSIHHELKYMVDAGLTPYEALRLGTVNVADYLNHSAEIGIIKEGFVSDLILLNGNPLNDISQTKNIEGVMLRDKWLSKEFIQKELKKLEKN